MNRKEFLRQCGILGLGLPFLGILKSCKERNIHQKVTIIGAGAAGLTAGYLFQQLGVEFEILEASATYGGRMKRSTTFADFPISLGAEWLHVEPSILGEIVNRNATTVAMNTIPYDSTVDYGLFKNQQITVAQMGFAHDRKFVNASWFDFFDQYIAPSIIGKIQFNEVVQSIDYTANKVVVKSQSTEYVSDKVIVTVPVKMLQKERIDFIPALPQYKQHAINAVTVWDGFKAFIEFSSKFYPAFTGFEVIPETAGQKLYYDAAYGQHSNKSILGLFAVGAPAQQLAALSDAALKDYMLKELDVVFNNHASANYVKHVSHNWNAEPYIEGAYVYDHENWEHIVDLAESVADKVFFAGTSYGFADDWGGVHVAARSAQRAVDVITR